MKRVAVVQAHNQVAFKIRQHLLYFDEVRLHLPSLEKELEVIDVMLNLIGAPAQFLSLNSDHLSELESFALANVIEWIDVKSIPERVLSIENSQSPMTQKDGSTLISIFQASMDQSDQLEQLDLPGHLKKRRFEKFVELAGTWLEINSKRSANIARVERFLLAHEATNIDSHLVTHGLSGCFVEDDSGSTVLSAVLRNIPEPAADVSLQQILEFRSDPDTRSKFLALRDWMSMMASKPLKATEADEKLEFLLDQYEQHIRFHRIKSQYGVLEVVLTTTAQALEDLVTVKWGRMVKSLFDLRRQQLELVTAEHSAPGKEVAYISKVKEEFSAPSPLPSSTAITDNSGFKL